VGRNRFARNGWLGKEWKVAATTWLAKERGEIQQEFEAVDVGWEGRLK
jgi:hypothetical protein